MVIFVGMVGSAAVGLTLGAVTERAQSLLPWSTSALANSAGSWVLVTFAVALTARNLCDAAARGTIGLVGLVAGFYIAQSLRGMPVAPRTILFWTAAGIVLGPLVGVAAGAVRRGRPVAAALGAGVLGGLLVGEALYGLHYIAASTSAEYWHAQLAVGVVSASGLAWWRSRHLLAVVPSGVACAVTAALTVSAYVRA
jgi:uncharacterized membrane protein